MYMIDIDDFGPDEEPCFAFVEADTIDVAAEKIFAEFETCKRNEDFNAKKPEDLVPFIDILEKGKVFGSY